MGQIGLLWSVPSQSDLHVGSETYQNIFHLDFRMQLHWAGAVRLLSNMTTAGRRLHVHALKCSSGQAHHAHSSLHDLLLGAQRSQLLHQEDAQPNIANCYPSKLDRETVRRRQRECQSRPPHCLARQKRTGCVVRILAGTRRHELWSVYWHVERSLAHAGSAGL